MSRGAVGPNVDVMTQWCCVVVQWRASGVTTGVMIVAIESCKVVWCLVESWVVVCLLSTVERGGSELKRGVRW